MVFGILILAAIVIWVVSVELSRRRLLKLSALLSTMPAEEFASINREDLRTALARKCYDHEKARRQGEFIVRITPISSSERGLLATFLIGGKYKLDVIWPKNCASCDCPNCSSVVQLLSSYHLSGWSYMTFKWNVPVCPACYQKLRGDFEIGEDGHPVSTEYPFIKVQLTADGEHYFVFQNHNQGARFKMANRGKYICSRCKHEVSDDDAFCTHCRLKQPSRSKGDS